MIFTSEIQARKEFNKKMKNLKNHWWQFWRPDSVVITSKTVWIVNLE